MRLLALLLLLLPPFVLADSAQLTELQKKLNSSPVLRSDFTQTLRGHNRMGQQAVWRQAQELNLRFIIYPTWHKPQPRLSRLGFVERYREGNLRVWEIPWERSDK